MPTYVCVVKAGLLNNLQKHRIAAAITRLHSETTGAPTWLVQVVIDENEQRQRYLSGQPADHQIWIRGDIRERARSFHWDGRAQLWQAHRPSGLIGG